MSISNKWISKMKNKIINSKPYRFLVNILRIPYIYLLQRGHIARNGWLSTDIDGNFIPWISYPAADFLDNIDTEQYSVFEYGSGSSTLWWANKAKTVISVEMNEEWYAYLRPKLPENSSVHLCVSGSEYPLYINRFNCFFDIIIVDGAERYKSAVAAVLKLSEGGIIILDNADWYPNTSKMLRREGFIQLDFYGFSPINSFPECTSIFMKDMKMFKKRYPIDKKVIGGKIIKGGTLDDHA